MKQDIANKKFLIVGANGALAMTTIKHLLKDGAKNITMATRTLSKGEAAKQSILNEVKPDASVELSVYGGFDMNDPNKLSEAIKALEGKEAFDTIFLAAGFAVFTDDYQSIEWNQQRIEKNVFQNLFGSHITLSLLKKHKLVADQARVVLAGGEGARGIPGMIEKPVFKSALQLRNYIHLTKAPKYNVMNAIGVSKFLGALWTRKLAQLEAGNMEVIWFSPGLTSKSSGLKTLSFSKRIMMSLVFAVMNLLGRSQGPEEGGRKNADVLEGKIGTTGDLLGAPQGTSIGVITDQTPMNDGFSNNDLIDELWGIIENTWGKYA